MKRTESWRDRIIRKRQRLRVPMILPCHDSVHGLIPCFGTCLTCKSVQPSLYMLKIHIKAHNSPCATASREDFCPAPPRVYGRHLTGTGRLWIGQTRNVFFGPLNLRFEFVAHFQLVFDEIIQPLADGLQVLNRQFGQRRLNLFRPYSCA
jgi:hypothetical protein